MRAFDRDLIRGGHYGQRSCEPHLKAEHTGAPTNAASVKKVLANSEPSTQGRKDPAPTYCPSAVVDLTPSPIRCPWVRMYETARRPNAKTSALFSCVHVEAAEVTLSRARDTFLCESV